jgi:alpha-L-fucosidase 2
MLEASRVLGRDAQLRDRWTNVRRDLAPYPQADGPYGRVWLDIANAPAEWVYNVPVTASPVFPGEQVGLDRRPELLDIARRTVRTVRLEGGNDLVWQPLMRARLAMLDLKWFKDEVRYCTLPNGIANDRVRQVGGRYRDDTPYDFMMRMGVWTENLSLPVVINECMLQSYAGVIRLFPNTKNLGRARFQNLRAVGAFLVSAAWDGSRVTAVSVFSEKGATVRIVNPWSGQVRVTTQGNPVALRIENGVIVFTTEPVHGYEILGKPTEPPRPRSGWAPPVAPPAG